MLRGMIPILLTLSLTALPEAGAAQKFYADDPVWVDPDNAIDVGTPVRHRLSDMYDFLLHTFGNPGDPVQSRRAVNVNTLGQVPDSSWFENRHGRTRMTLEELVRGPDTGQGPAQEGVWTVTEGKSQGITPGFQIEDARGDVYFIKFDPPDNPELATAAEVISTKFFYAMGYHVPENYLIQMNPERLRLDPEATVEAAVGVERAMTQADLDVILSRIHRSQDGTHRAVASKRLPGRSDLGPFTFYGTRPDDANDVFAHENRRELRGLRALAAWLNHDDSRAINTLDMLVTENGSSFVRHYLIDFGSTLGSGSVAMQKPRAGFEYMWEGRPALLRILTGGLWDREWVRIRYPDYPSIGRFESEHFRPEAWKPEYPNPAFDRATTEDMFWAARILMAFTDDDIRAIVETGRLTDPAAEAYLIEQLIARRDTSVEYYLGRINPIDGFRIGPERNLLFENPGVDAGLATECAYGYGWHVFDNQSETLTPLGDDGVSRATAVRVPDSQAEFLMARITSDCPGQPSWSLGVDVYLRNGATLSVVGVERETPRIAAR
jgi:hypothetical protein